MLKKYKYIIILGIISLFLIILFSLRLIPQEYNKPFESTLSIIAFLISPFLGIYTQKLIENYRLDKSKEVEENKIDRNKKLHLFTTLISTKDNRIDQAHIQALNLIDLIYYDILDVIEQWEIYSMHLNKIIDRNSEAELRLWGQKYDELFYNLLNSMAKHLGYKFNRAKIESRAYSPIAYNKKENDDFYLRQLATDILSGKTPLKVTQISSEPLAASEYIKMISNINNTLKNGTIKVEVQEVSK